MPFNHYLSKSINHELTHQLILEILLQESKFLAALTGLHLNNYSVILEPEGSLFDIGIKPEESEDWLFLIEIKMWSQLSEQQLHRQTAFLQQQKGKGLHILLGTADLIYYNKGDYDKISIQTNNASRKIGYQTMINALKDFVAIEGNSKIAAIATDYTTALQKQYVELMGAWKEKAYQNSIVHYSLYYHMMQYLPYQEYKIYTVNNAAGGATILNDQLSWRVFNYKSEQFEVYQEVLDGTYMIRIYSKSADSHLRNKLKQVFISQFRSIDQSVVPWNDYSNASKWHKIITYRPQIQNESDIKALAEILIANRVLIDEVIDEIEEQVATGQL